MNSAATAANKGGRPSKMPVKRPKKEDSSDEDVEAPARKALKTSTGCALPSRL